MMLPLRSEALYLYEQGIASKEDIDTAIKLGYEVHYGPIEYCDVIGLETVQDILKGKEGIPLFRPFLLYKRFFISSLHSPLDDSNWTSLFR